MRKQIHVRLGTDLRWKSLFLISDWVGLGAVSKVSQDVRAVERGALVAQRHVNSI